MRKRLLYTSSNLLWIGLLGDEKIHVSTEFARKPSFIIFHCRSGGCNTFDCYPVNIPDPNPPPIITTTEWTPWATATPTVNPTPNPTITREPEKPGLCSLVTQDPSNCDCPDGVTAPVGGCGTGTIPFDYRKCIGADCDWTEQIR